MARLVGRPSSFANVRVVCDAGPSSFGLALDDRFVYGAAYQGTNGAFRVARAAGPLESLGPALWARDVGVDARDLFWARTGDVPGGSVWSMPKAGGAAREFAPNQAGTDAVAVDATHVYWSNSGGYDGAGRTLAPEIRRIHKSGGPIETLAAVHALRIKLVDTDVYVLTNGPIPYSSSGSVLKIPKSGGATTVIAAAGVNPVDFDVDETHVYWTVAGEYETPPQAPCKSKTPCPVATVAPIVRHGELRRVLRTGGPVDTLAKDLRRAGPLTLGQSSVLYGVGDSILELPKSGGSPQARVNTSASSRFVADSAEAFVITGGKIIAFGP